MVGAGVEDLPPKAEPEASARHPACRGLSVVSVTSQLGLEKGCPCVGPSDPMELGRKKLPGDEHLAGILLPGGRL